MFKFARENPWTTLLIAFLTIIFLGSIACIVWETSFLRQLWSVHINNKPEFTSKVAPGDTLSISYRGQGLSELGIEYTVDGGTTWKSIQDNVSKTKFPYRWVVPSDIYSNNVQVQVFDPRATTKRFAVSSKFQVVPTISLTTDLPVTLKSPGSLTVSWKSDSSLLEESNTVFEISTDGGANWKDPPGSGYVVLHAQRQNARWVFASDLAGQSVLLRITTNNLKSKGYPSEITAASNTPIVLT